MAHVLRSACDLLRDAVKGLGAAQLGLGLVGGKDARWPKVGQILNSAYCRGLPTYSKLGGATVTPRNRF